MEVVGDRVYRWFDEGNRAADEQTSGHQVAHGKCHGEMHDCETHCPGHRPLLLPDRLNVGFSSKYGGGLLIVEIVFDNLNDR